MTLIPEIKPNQSVELLKALHILTRDGKINQDSRRKLKQVYHFYHLSVEESIKSPALPEQVDIVTALHACNTATDDAIRFGLEKRARFIVLVPCCQAEVAEVLRKHKSESFTKTPLSEIWRHPIHTREFGSQITNVLRCLQLEAHGYQVTVTELVGWEHSMKNELIIARYKNSPRKNAQVRLEQILQELNLEEVHSRFVY